MAQKGVKTDNLPALTDSETRILEFRLANPSATRAEIADAVGLSPRQVVRLLSSDHMRAAAHAAHENILGTVTATLKGLLLQAVTALGDIVSNQRTNASDRIAAAKAILSTAPGLDVLAGDPDPRGERPKGLIIELDDDDDDEQRELGAGRAAHRRRRNSADADDDDSTHGGAN